MSEYVLELKDITKEFPGVKALNGVSLKLKKGEVLALVGENGAGKSTLMKVLSGAYSCATYGGEVWVNNEQKHFHSAHDSELAGIEMIYQEIGMINDLSIAENIFLNNYPDSNGVFFKWPALFRQAKNALQRVGLDIDPRIPVKNLNTSQQQMVAIAKALEKEPKILVLDEPTSVLTDSESKYLFDIIKEITERGVSCIFISHKLEEVFEITDRVVVMRDGEVVGEVERADYNEDKIINMMVGRVLDNRYPKEDVPVGKEILKVENLSIKHRFIKDKDLVSGVGFSVNEGEILGIAGLVGSGRSEVVNAVFGSMKKKEGCKIYVSGKEVRINNPRAAIRSGIALVTEDRRKTGIIGQLTIRENASLVALRKLFKNCIISYSKEKKAVGEYKSKLAIKAPTIEERVRNLSGGNQQKVVLSRWLMNSPKILLLDEPTRGIDVGSKYEIYKIMVELAKQGMAIVMISSELNEIIGMCDRVLVFARGRVKGELTRQELTEDRIMGIAAGIQTNKTAAEG